MKKIVLTLALVAFTATSAMAFSLDAAKDPKKAQMTACMSSEAQSSLVKGELNKDNVDKVAAKIAAACAAKVALKTSPENTAAAAAILKALLNK